MPSIIGFPHHTSANFTIIAISVFSATVGFALALAIRSPLNKSKIIGQSQLDDGKEDKSKSLKVGDSRKVNVFYNRLRITYGTI